MDIVSNLQAIRQQIVQAAQRVKRDPAEITLVAVTKTVPIERIKTVFDAGQTVFGENRVQEALTKYEHLPEGAKWHLIGHLQTNKVKHVGMFELIHSLDRLNLAQALDRQAKVLGRKINVLVQVNVAGEETKYGLSVEEVIPFIRKMQDYEGIQVQGLMTIAPLVDDPEKVRPYFRRLYMLKEEIARGGFSHVKMQYLSMGMTNDFVVAIEEGSNMVRIGSGIFGARS